MAEVSGSESNQWSAIMKVRQSGGEDTPYILGVCRIPDFIEAIETPFNALDPLIELLLLIPGREELLMHIRPVTHLVKIQQA